MVLRKCMIEECGLGRQGLDGGDRKRDDTQENEEGALGDSVFYILLRVHIQMSPRSQQKRCGALCISRLSLTNKLELWMSYVGPTRIAALS